MWEVGSVGGRMDEARPREDFSVQVEGSGFWV
jgi:hypothetical protein